MQRHRIGRSAGIILAILITAIAATISGWAQKNDTPIVILDGSLKIRSETPWKDFTGSGDQKSHPDGTRSITQVVVTVGGKDQTIDFNKQPCSVDVTYAGSHILVTSGQDGKGLRIAGLNSFVNGESPNHLMHKNQNSKISHVTVTKAGAKAFDSNANGGTKVVISYK